MIKTLIGKIETAKEIHLIKKHLRIAKKHKSCEELEKVKFELLDIQGKLIVENKYTESINSKMLNLLAEIDHFKLNNIPAADIE